MPTTRAKLGTHQMRRLGQISGGYSASFSVRFARGRHTNGTIVKVLPVLIRYT
jgi:hypothetical protein